MAHFTAMAAVLGLMLVSAALAQQGVTGATRSAEPATRPSKPAIWLRYHASHADDQAVQRTLDLMRRASAAGYTHLLIVDNQFARWNTMTPQYLQNIRKVRQACREMGLAYVPALLPIGYANDLLSNDPNLAEAIPVVEAPFVVRDGKLVPADDLRLENGTFERHRDNVPEAWEVDAPGKAVFIDTEVTYEGKPSLRIENPRENNPGRPTRAWQTLKVRPWRYYHMSVAIRTEDYTGRDVRLMALGVRGATHEGHRLNIPYAYAQRTQDWTRLHYTFNTQECEVVSIYVGDWAGGSGRLWFADVTLEAAGLVNLVRREGAPFKATLEDGTTLLEEGRDLPEVVDPLLGRSPRSGDYRWHEHPEVVIPPGGRLKEGDVALLSYSHTMWMCYGNQMVICMAEPKTNELLRWQIANVHRHLEPDGYFMMHDEIRIAGWDESCRRTGKTPGGILADHIRFCTDTIWEHDPGKPIYVWSDMFDRHHNAGHVGRYYEIVRGKDPWSGSWEGLSPQVGLVNWNAASLDSLKWFAGRGHRQLVSGDKPDYIVKCLESARDLPGIEGVIYVTWSNDYSRLEAVAEAARKWFGQRR